MRHICLHLKTRIVVVVRILLILMKLRSIVLCPIRRQCRKVGMVCYLLLTKFDKFLIKMVQKYRDFGIYRSGKVILKYDYKI